MTYDTPDTVDYLVLGGGTAGSIVASRLSEDGAVSVGLVEAGPSDADEPRAHSIRRWAEMLEGQYDLDYRSVPTRAATPSSGRPGCAFSVDAPPPTP